MSEGRDLDGYADLGSYLTIGDGRGAALVSSDGRIDWWATPRLDAPPAFAAILDPQRGGFLELRPRGEHSVVEHGYVRHTNQVRTVYQTPAGQASVIVSLNSGNAGALPWSELAFRIESPEGETTFDFLVRPGDGLRQWEPWVDDDRRGPLFHAGPLTMAFRADEATEVRVEHTEVSGCVTVEAGGRQTVGVVAASADPLYLTDVESIDHRIDVTSGSWREWSTQVRWPGPGRERILRSALALKTLVIAETGAVAAAATTSLPESIGGPKNWDYRFAWVRDAALTIDALALLGLQEEVHAAVSWLLHAIRRNGPHVHVMYTLEGAMPEDMTEPLVPGYRHSQPVAVGNTASGQTQLGVYGDLFGTVANWVTAGHVLDVSTTRELADLADRCADEWRGADAGIWELHTNRQYTLSKMNCWRALDAAARLASQGHLPGNGRRWRGEAAVIHRWVRDNCWSDRRKAYTFFAGSDDLDASVMLGAATSFDIGRRMSSTIDAVGEELAAGPLLYRYSGVQHEEFTFTACAFWRVHALVQVGRVAEAGDLMRELLAVVDTAGVMSEMIDPVDKSAVGNVPQALSHLAFITAANALLAAERTADGS